MLKFLNTQSKKVNCPNEFFYKTLPVSHPEIWGQRFQTRVNFLNPSIILLICILLHTLATQLYKMFFEQSTRKLFVYFRNLSDNNFLFLFFIFWVIFYGRPSRLSATIFRLNATLIDSIFPPKKIILVYKEYAWSIHSKVSENILDEIALCSMLMFLRQKTKSVRNTWRNHRFPSNAITFDFVSFGHNANIFFK